MDLKNKTVIHKIFGKGLVTNHSEEYIAVKFGMEVKEFSFPNAFESFLRVQDETLDKKVQDILKAVKIDKERSEEEKNKVEKNKVEKNKIEKNKVEKTINSRLVKPQRKVAKRNNEKVYPKENIAFKCNFSDGGQSAFQIGFNGVCSDAIIHHNIYKEKRSWCSSDECSCKEYMFGKITRKELDSFCKNEGFVCYESQMLRDWTAMAGVYRTGDNEGKPMKLKKVQTNSLCFLTTRDPQSDEEDRYIFAVFLVDDTYQGGRDGTGYVSANPEFKLKFAPKEARSLLFWNYHRNTNQPEVSRWNSGLHRYIDDEEAARMLLDIKKIKKGTKDESLAEKFLPIFARLTTSIP